MRNKILSSLSRLAIIIVCLVYIGEFIPNHKAAKGEVLQWDVQEYYMYLPAAFIYHDLDYKFVDKLPDDLKKHYWLTQTDAKPISRMTMGMALTYAPFFLLGHITALISGQPANGFSPPYQFFVLVSGFFYALMGFILLRKVLLRYFSEKAAAFSILILGLGTNLYYYITTEGAMTHATLFGFFALFLYATMRWYENHRFIHIFLLTVALGMSTLIRPTTLLMSILFLGYDIRSWENLEERLRLFLKYSFHFIGAAAILAAIAFPQLLYWKLQTGHWIFYSYGDQRFYFDKPHILAGLFSYRKGWLIYTPVMILSLLGFFSLYKFSKSLFWPILIFSLVNMYIIFSWWCWWYGGSFGMRAMIESYAFLALPLTAFWERLLRLKLSFGLATAFAALAIILNLFQTKQYRAAIIHWDSMTGKAYWYVFGRMRYAPQEYLQTPDYEGAMKGQECSPEELNKAEITNQK